MSIKRTLGALAVFTLAAAPTVLTGQTIGYNSSVAFPILSTGFSARAVGMGEAFTAISDDLSALHYNPAGLAQLDAPELSLTHMSYLDTGFYEAAAFALPLRSSGTLAWDLRYLNYGSVEQRDSSGDLTGTFSPFDLALGGAFGFSLDKNLALGVASQWMRQEIDGSVHMGILWDAGLWAMPWEGLSVGVALRNLGLETGGSDLPTVLALGTACRWGWGADDRQLLTLGLEGDISFQSVSYLSGGLEYSFQHQFFLRTGYSYGFPQDSSGRGFDFGGGIRVEEFQLDYSFSFMGELGNVQRLSLSVFLPGAPLVENAPTETQPQSSVPSLEPPGSNSSPAPSQDRDSSDRPVILKFRVVPDEDLTASQLFEKAEQQNALGLHEEALDLYLKAVAKDPSLEKAWTRLGRLYFDRSLDAYGKALELDPQNGPLRDWLEKFK